MRTVGSTGNSGRHAEGAYVYLNGCCMWRPHRFLEMGSLLLCSPCVANTRRKLSPRSKYGHIRIPHRSIVHPNFHLLPRTYLLHRRASTAVSANSRSTDRLYGVCERRIGALPHALKEENRKGQPSTRNGTDDHIWQQNVAQDRCKTALFQ